MSTTTEVRKAKRALENYILIALQDFCRVHDVSVKDMRITGTNSIGGASTPIGIEIEINI